ncbi:MAG: hypothetical protein RL339_88 [Pseudomonadota bacterium]|jgi:hypothetical protein
MSASKTGSMSKGRNSAASALLLAAAVTVLALPSAVLALSVGIGPAISAPSTAESDAGFQPARVDPRLARSISVRALGKGQTFRFTPGAAPSRLDRSVTVAVRVDGNPARPVRSALANSDSGGFGIAPTAYSLGVSRGYKGFAQNGSVATEIRKAELPDLASFKPSPGAKGDPSRFSPRIALDGREPAGRSPRTLQGQTEEVVDLGGSYRLTRNINVTAGVRSTSDRDRLAPLSDARKDNQAVYVGTQFKF